jgi:hypothetical protein
MRTFLSLFLIYISLESVIAQQYDCGELLLNYKTANENGVKLLVEWTENSKVITKIPNNTIIKVCGEVTYDKWVKAYYKDTVGYVEKGSIKTEEQINVVILSHWRGEQFPHAQEYFGIFEKDDEYGTNHTIIERCLTKSDTVTTYKGKLDSISVINQDATPLILVSGFDIETGPYDNGELFSSKFLYPGEAVIYNYADNFYLIYAKGDIQQNTDSSNFSPFTGIKNYELHVKRTLKGKTEDVLLYKMDLRSWNAFQYEGGVHLHWIGDIDGDKQLDIILTTSNHYACWVVSFFLSSQAEPGYFFKEVAKYPDCGC